MSRFHDEFFQQKGTEHDDLIIRCVSEEIDNISSSCIINYHAVLNVVNHMSHSGMSDRIDIVSQKAKGYETEAIVKGRNGFILGYADLIIYLEFEIGLRTGHTLDDLKQKYGEYFYNSCIKELSSPVFGFVVVEVKPKLDDVGAVIRQIKTYADSYHANSNREDPRFRGVYLPQPCVGKCIVTQSTTSEQVKKFLAHEEIGILTLERV